MPMGTEPVSPCTISTFSIGTPSVSATSWEKVVSWPWPWLCEPVKMVTEPVGLKRTCADSQRPTPAPSEPTTAEGARTEEHTSELQSLMRNSYAVFCLKKKSKNQQ